MTTVHVHVEGESPKQTARGTGQTVVLAVRSAIRRMGVRIGYVLWRGERINSHEQKWIVSYNGLNRILIVHESRSGPKGRPSPSKVQVKLWLEEKDHFLLNRVANAHEMSRSKLVAVLVHQAAAALDLDDNAPSPPMKGSAPK